MSGASSRRPGKVGGWSYALLTGQRERAEPRGGVPRRLAGGVTLASRGSASEQSLLLAASREGGRVALR